MTGHQPDMAIAIRNLSVGYASVSGEAFFSRSNLSFSARKGEMVALIGPNGIGKSTLLRTLGGFQKPLAGEVSYYGEPLPGFSPGKRARTLSFVSTESLQVPNMRVAELVAYGRFPYTNWLGKTSADDRRLVLEAIEKVGLGGFANRQVTRLSDGERQRALIARALAQDTPVILLDEPTAFLDVNNKYEIFHLLHQLARQNGKTILLSTHDLNIALREMDKFWILLEDEALEGAPEDAVLNGWLDRLFSSEHIGFDNSAGEFFFRKKQAGTVAVEGEGVTQLWTVRALERRGYSLNQAENADLRITIETDDQQVTTWLLTTGSHQQRFDSLYDLLIRI